MSFKLPKDEYDGAHGEKDGAGFGMVGPDTDLSNYNTT
jgi:hypothetical protein